MTVDSRATEQRPQTICDLLLLLTANLAMKDIDITEVQRREGRGRCLIARQALNLGNLILGAQPVSAVLEEAQARAYCAGCFGSIGDKHGGKGSRCSGCKMMWYCSRSCQKADWTEHRPECKQWASQKSGRKPTRTLRLAGRILHSMNRSDTDGKSTRTREAVAELVDHNDDRTPEQREEYKLMATFVAGMCVTGCGKGALSWPSADGRGFPGLVDAAFAIIGKISCNVFSIVVDVGGHVVGCGLYLEAATANHSCNPNASQSFDGRTLSLRCTRPIAVGEEVTIGITEMHRPGEARRQALRTSYFFECRCERCNSGGACCEEARLEGYACLDQSCSGVCAKPRTAGATEKETNSAGEREDGAENSGCLVCSVCASAWPAEEAVRKSKAVCELLGRGKALVAGGKAPAGRECLEEALRRAVGCLYISNWMLAEVYSELLSTCLELEDFDAAAEHALNGIHTHRACLAGLLPYFAPWANHLALAGKLALCVRRQPTQAMPLLEEALASLEVTYGERHPLYREVRDLLDQASLGG